jgi:gas vesicle protein
LIGELLVFIVVVAVIAIVGVVVGMLVAPRLGRMSERIAEPKDEDAGDGTD